MVILPTLIKDIPQSEELTILRNNAIHKNRTIFHKIFISIAFFQSLIFFVLLHYSFGISISFLFITFGIAISLCYVITKDMSGGGSKLEEKQSKTDLSLDTNKEINYS